jgi:hypothetical protein
MKAARITRPFFLFCILAALCTGCATMNRSGGSDAAQPPIPSGPLWEGDGGAGIRLAVVQPGGSGLGEKEAYLLDIIHGTLSDDFQKFSEINLVDRQYLNNILEEQELSLSGNFSEENYISIGQLANAQYILNGTLSKIPGQGFNLQLVIADTEAGLQKATFNKTGMTSLQLRTGAVKEASESLLGQMGVLLTDAGHLALSSGSQAAAAQTDLALSIDAGKRGNTVEELIYGYSAVDRDASLLEASSRLNALSAEVSSGGLGLDIRSDVENRTWWKTRMTEFETYYDDRPPFDIVYTPVPVQKGRTDYEASGGAAADFEFSISLRPTRDLSVMQKVLNDIGDGLEKTHNKEKWGFADWPGSSPLFQNYKTYKTVLGLFNAYDEVLSEITVPLHGQIALIKSRIGLDSVQRIKIIFSGVKVATLTSDMQVRVISLNGIDAEEAGDEAGWVITAVEKMPRGKRSGIPKKLMKIPGAVAIKPESRKRTRRGAGSESPAYRIGLSGASLLSPSAFNASSWIAGLELRLKKLALEAQVQAPFDTGIYDDPAVAANAGDVYGFNVGLGGAIGNKFVLASILAGYNHTNLHNNESVNLPYAQLKLDIMPWRRGLGFRLGYMAEAGSMGWGDVYERYFNERWAYKINDSFRINGKITAGLVLWF